MKLDFAFLADAATITDDGLFAVVGGGFDLLRAESFPAIKSAMALVGRVDFEASEIGQTYHLHGELIGPGGIILEPDLWPQLKPPTDPPRGKWITICFNYQGVSFPTSGDYSVRLSVAHQVLGQVQLAPNGFSGSNA